MLVSSSYSKLETKSSYVEAPEIQTNLILTFIISDSTFGRLRCVECVHSGDAQLRQRLSIMECTGNAFIMAFILIL